MKKKLYILGLVDVGVIVLGAIFKLNHLPGAGILLSAGIITMVFIFLPLALWSNFRYEDEKQPALLNIVTWITCFVIFISMLFKLMHWPGAGKMLMVALPFPFLVYLPVYLVVTSRIKGYSIYKTVNVLFLLAAVAVISALLALNVTKERINDSLALSEDYNKVEALLADLPHQETDKAMYDGIDNVLAVVDDYQREILMVYGLSEEEWNKNPQAIVDYATRKVGAAGLIRGDGQHADTRLEDALIALLKISDEAGETKALTMSIGDVVGLRKPFHEHGLWSNLLFGNVTLSWVLVYLDGLETDLKIIRSTL